MSEHESDESRPSAADEPAALRLAEVREQRGLSQTDVARELRLDVKLIAALEDKALDRLPDPIYVTGYLRNYARLLELPEGEVLASFNLKSPEAPALMPGNLGSEPLRRVSVITARNVALLLAVLALVGVGAWWWLQGGSGMPVGPAPGAPAETPAPTLAPPAQQEAAPQEVTEPPRTEEAPSEPAPETPPEAAPPAAPAAPGADAPPAAVAPAADVSPATSPASASLVLNYLDDSWTEVQDADGRRLVFRMVTEGTRLRLDGRPPFRVVFGFAPAVEVFYRGERIRTEPYTRNDVARFRVGTTAANTGR